MGADSTSNLAWLLNLDAELELRATNAYSATARVRANMQQRFRDSEGLTLRDPVVDRDPVDSSHLVYCWCPTPSALRYLAMRGLPAVAGPELGVLKRANHRRWLARLQPQLLERRFIGPGDDWQQLVLGRTSSTGAWRLKRCYGFAGRAQRRVASTFSDDDQRWVLDSMRQGGVLREANVGVLEEFSIHGYVDRDGVILGQPVRFSTDAFGAPSGNRQLALLPEVLHATLDGAARQVAAHLDMLGYFGPFGIDAFTWRASPTEVGFNPISDINARFTLAWSLGIGRQRTAALARYASARRGR